MSTLRNVGWMVVAMALWASPGRAGGPASEIRPSFDLEDLSWLASHIVVAEAVDGKFRVVDSWKGDLAPDEILNIRRLEQMFTPSSARKIERIFGGNDGPEHVSNRRMVLFLVGTGPRFGRVWRHAHRWGDFGVSVAWIEGKDVYAKVQVINPGAPQIVKQQRGRDAFEKRVRAVAQCAERFTQELTSPLPLRCRFYRDVLVGDIYPARMAAVEALTHCGSAGLDTLRQARQLSEVQDFAWHVVPAFARFGESAVPVYREILDEQLRFWKPLAPVLQRGWWNGAGLEHARVQELRKRYGELTSALRALPKLPPAATAPLRSRIEAVRAQWSARPALSEVGGRQMIRACDRALGR